MNLRDCSDTGLFTGLARGFISIPILFRSCLLAPYIGNASKNP